MTEPLIILIDDEDDIRKSYAQTLELAGQEVRTFATAEDALDLLGYEFTGVVVTDIRLPGLDGMTLLGRVREIDPDIPVILVTGHADLPLAVRAMREGAYDFVEKPVSAQHLANVVERAANQRRLLNENRHLREIAGNRDALEARLPGRSGRMVDLRYQLRAVAQTDADVLIVGETGSGKGVTARALHDLSHRSGHPFVVVDCAALPAHLIESELFGHELGAFPGAVRTRFGRFEHARTGTVLLDEIGSISLELQAKLLRVIEDRFVTRVGSNEPVRLDVRFVATSKVPLEAEVAANRFRADLLYRLNVVTLHLPPLAERREDVPLLFLQLIEEATVRYRRPDVRVPAWTLSEIGQRTWPGNIRELRNAADRYVLGLPLDDRKSLPSASAGQKLADRVAEFERGFIADTLLASNGSLRTAYEALGVSRKTLYEKMHKYGLDKRDFAGNSSALADDEPEDDSAA